MIIKLRILLCLLIAAFAMPAAAQSSECEIVKLNIQGQSYRLKTEKASVIRLKFSIFKNLSNKPKGFYDPHC